MIFFQLFPRVRWSRKGRSSCKKKRKGYFAHKETARATILSRLHFWNAHYGLSWKRVSIRDTKSRWGSCSRIGNLNFSYRLIFLSQELLDYVVVHELCHLKEFNHSPAFWSHVAEMMPDWRERRKALRTASLDRFF